MSRLEYLNKIVEKELERVRDLAKEINNRELGYIYLYINGELLPQRAKIEKGELNLFNLLKETSCSNACTIFELSDKLKDIVVWKKRKRKKLKGGLNE